MTDEPTQQKETQKQCRDLQSMEYITAGAVLVAKSKQ